MSVLRSTFGVAALLLISFTGLAQSADPGAKTAFAVTHISSAGSISADEATVIADRLRVELFKTGKVAMMEREQMESILKEQGFQKSGACNEEQCLVEMGRLLGVQCMVSGSIGSVGKLLVLNFRVIDVESGKITRALSRDVQGGAEQIIKLLPSVADEIVKSEVDASEKPGETIEGNTESEQSAKSQPAAGSPPIERPVRFGFVLKGINTYLGGGLIEPGFGLQLDLRIKNHLVGILANFPVSSFYSFYGGGLNYGYSFNIGKIMRLTPSLAAGVWIEALESDSTWVTGSYYYNHYFGGPGFRLELGKKHVFFSLDATVLFGDEIPKFLIEPGVSILF